MENSNVRYVADIIVDVLDAETLQVKRTQRETNTITKAGMTLLSGGVGLNPYLSNGSSGNFAVNAGFKWNAVSLSPNDPKSGSVWQDFVFYYSTFNSTTDAAIFISTNSYHANSYLPTQLENTIASSAIIDRGTYYAGPPEYFNYKQRFNAPASARTINTVCLGSLNSFGSFSNPIFTLAKLSNPCTQGTTEILDITYRIQLVYNTILNSQNGSQLMISDNWQKSYVYGSTGKVNSGRGGSIFYKLLPHKLHSKTNQYRGWALSEGADSSQVVVSSAWNSKGTMSFSWDITQGVGRVVQSLTTKNNIATSAVSGNGYANSPDLMFGVFDKFGGSEFTNKPIQPVILHSSGSTIPFADITNSGSSMGSLSINGSAWTNPQLPEYYRLHITNGGDVGTAKYMFAKSILTGFQGNTFNPLQVELSFTDSCHNTSYNGTDPNYTLLGMHGSSKFLPTQIEEYTDTKFVFYDLTGISIVDIGDGNAVTFDSTTTHALHVTNIKQVAVNFSNGDVWVACSNTGIFRIQNPFGSPTITQITTIGSFTGIASAYAISLGYNNSIWVAINGAIARTDDNGTSWTTYTTSSSPAISYPGITDSNWSRISYIKTDIQSPNHELAIIYGTDSSFTNLNVCWWSITQSGIAGPTGIAPSISYTRLNRNNLFRCSHYGSTWIGGYQYSTTSSYAFVKIYKFGTSTTISTLNSYATEGSSYSTEQYNIPFYYDYYNVPYTIVNKQYNSTAYAAIFNARGVKQTVINLRNYYAGNGASYYTAHHSNNGLAPYTTCLFSCYGINASYNKSPLVHANKILLGTSDYVVGAGGYNNYYAGYVKNISPSPNYADGNSNYYTTGGFTPDQYNGRYTPFEEMLWQKYHWNPNTSTWQKNYYAPAIDSSSYATNGIRHNFNTESHYFTGRSLIDVSSSIANLGSVFTVAVNVNAASKLTAVNQPVNSTIFSIEDSNQIFRLVWSGATGNFEIHSATAGAAATVTSLGNSLVVGNSYRIVAVVNGTTCSVYQNGVQLGTNVTIPTYSFAASTTLKAYVGAEVYYNTLHTKTPLPDNFFRGTLTNFQVWNVNWDSTDISSDNGNNLGVISSKPASNNLIRLQLNEAIIETKTTHNTADAFSSGITMKFNTFSSTPSLSFVSGDYYTFGVVDGILKDNVTSLSHSFKQYGYVNANVNYSDVVNYTGGNTITTVAGSITTPIHWGPFGGSSNWYTLSCAGQLSFPYNNVACWANERIVADGQIDFYLPHDNIKNLQIALSNNVIDSSAANMTYTLYFTAGGNVDVWESGTKKTSSSITHVIGDKFTIKRVGTTITYLKNNVVFYTSATASTGTLTIKAYNYYLGTNVAGVGNNGVVDATVTYTNSNPMMFVGNPTTITGCFSRGWQGVDTDNINSITATIAGVPAAITVYTNWYVDQMATPSSGQILFHPFAGVMIFNPADIGKTVSFSCISISDILS